MVGDYQRDARVFKALCDPKRLAILEQLRDGEKCACMLLEPMDLTQSGLSYHMKVLCDSGLVTARPGGQMDTLSPQCPGKRKSGGAAAEADHSLHGTAQP